MPYSKTIGWRSLGPVFPPLRGHFRPLGACPVYPSLCLLGVPLQQTFICVLPRLLWHKYPLITVPKEKKISLSKCGFCFQVNVEMPLRHIQAFLRPVSWRGKPRHCYFPAFFVVERLVPLCMYMHTQESLTQRSAGFPGASEHPAVQGGRAGGIKERK